MSSLFAALESFDDTQTDIQDNPGAEFEGSIEPLAEQMDEANEIAHDLEVESHAQALDEESIQRTETALEGLESLYGTLKASLAKGGISPESSIILTSALEGHAATMGVTFRSYLLPAAESYSDAPESSTTAALEGIGDTIKAGWDKLVEMVKKAAEWIAEMWSKFTSLFKKQEKIVDQVTEQIKMIEQKSGDVEVEVESGVVETIKDTTDKLLPEAREKLSILETKQKGLERYLESINSNVGYSEEQAKELAAVVKSDLKEVKRNVTKQKVKVKLSWLADKLRVYKGYKAFRNGMSALGDRITNLFNSIKGKVAGWFKSKPKEEKKDLPSTTIVLPTGEGEATKRGMISKAINGFRSQWSSFVSWVNGITQRFLSAVRNLWTRMTGAFRKDKTA